jgi:hypothetical protein
MREQDGQVFQQVAVEENLWILVRDTNPASLKYITRPGYAPKPINCKAKTAKVDVGVYRTAGLVTSPRLQPQAFPPEKLRSTTNYWDDMMFHKPRGYRLDENRRSIHYGCLMLNGLYIHGDYDLYDIVVPGHETANLASIETLLGQRHNRGPRLIKVQDKVNEMIGCDMVQHGAEMQYADDYTDDRIFIFTPKGEVGEVKGKNHLAYWIKEHFGERRFISGPPVENPQVDENNLPEGVISLKAFRDRKQS